MKIYFSSTIKAKKTLGKNFELIHQTIQDLGHKNVSSFLKDVNADKFYQRPSGIADAHYRQMIREIKSADVVIFEVSVASLGVGYLVNLVLEMEKPVVLLHTKDYTPYLFRFLKSERLQMYEYESENIKKVLMSALETARELTNVRFTFFATPKILHFFDFIARKRKIPRAVYLRHLLEEAMKKEKFKTSSPF